MVRVLRQARASNGVGGMTTTTIPYRTKSELAPVHEIFCAAQKTSKYICFIDSFGAARKQATNDVLCRLGGFSPSTRAACAQPLHWRIGAVDAEAYVVYALDTITTFSDGWPQNF